MHNTYLAVLLLPAYKSVESGQAHMDLEQVIQDLSVEVAMGADECYPRCFISSKSPVE